MRLSPFFTLFLLFLPKRSDRTGRGREYGRANDVHHSRDEWNELIARYPPGTRVSGVVLSREPYGVWIELDQLPGVRALLEIFGFAVLESDPRQRIEFPDDYPEVGARLTARVLAWRERGQEVYLTQLSQLVYPERNESRHNEA